MLKYEIMKILEYALDYESRPYSWLCCRDGTIFITKLMLLLIEDGLIEVPSVSDSTNSLDGYRLTEYGKKILNSQGYKYIGKEVKND